MTEPSPGASAHTLTAGNADDGEAVELLRKRVAAFSLIFGMALLASLFMRAFGLYVWREYLAFIPDGTIPLQAVGTASLLGIWALGKPAPRVTSTPSGPSATSCSPAPTYSRATPSSRCSATTCTPPRRRLHPASATRCPQISRR